MFFLISTDFTPPPGIPTSPKPLNSVSIAPIPKVRPWSLKGDLTKRLRYTLRPVNPDNACTPRITAAAGTKLAGAYSRGTVKISSLAKGVYTP